MAVVVFPQDVRVIDAFNRQQKWMMEYYKNIYNVRVL